VPDLEKQFDKVTCQVPAMSALQAMWNEAEEILRDSVLTEGPTWEEIGRTAYDMLPEAERGAAMDDLFYAWGAALEADRATRARQNGGA